MMARTNQGGSILGFVIIGGVMALLLVGGAYFVRHNLAAVVGGTSGSADGGSPTKPSTEDGMDTEEEETETGQPDEENSDQPSENEATTPNEDEPGAVTPTPDEPVQDDTHSSPNGGHQAESGHDSNGNLPQTGSADMLLSGLLFSVVVGMIAAYLRSRLLSSL